METDKVVADIPSPKGGVIIQLFGEVGDVIHVGKPLVEIELEGTTEATNEPEEETAGVVGTLELADSNALLPASLESQPVSADEIRLSRKALATPHARAIARELGIDINQITGNGPSGRVRKEDIENYNRKMQQTSRNQSAPAAETEDLTYETLTQIRKVIAKNMMNSKLNAAHVTIFEEIEISELIAIRNRYKDDYAARGAKLTYLPFIVKATVLALKKHRQLNSEIDMENERMIYKNRYNIGIAIDTPEGLVVPVIRDADRLTIAELTQKITEYSLKARERKLTLDDLREGTFTISNFGSISGIFGTPVINYPQAGILGIGRIVKKPVVKNDALAIGNVLGLSMTVDHRIVDGGETARFVKCIIDYLSDPISLMMD
jgi:pyruvate dehydrogenase E2 component (dihydrolipoamide acetyltransferase)